MNTQIKWDYTTDVVVVGSGAGGMTAAIRAHDLGLKVLLIEKATTYGGTSAMSGGSIWIPCNEHMAKENIEDNKNDALSYIYSCIKGKFDKSRVTAYVENAARVIRNLESSTQLEFQIVHGMPDYYPEHPGARLQGRTLETVPYQTHRLGNAASQLHPPHPQELMLGLSFSAEEAIEFIRNTKKSFFLFFIILFKHLWAKIWHKTGDVSTRLCLGNALVGRLYASLLDRKITLWNESTFCDLILNENITQGIIVEKNGKRLNIEAKQGVILATGGFAKNQKMRDQYETVNSSSHWSSAQENDNGDAIQAGLKIGAGISLMEEAWWMPVTLIPGKAIPWLLVFEKAWPGSILVNQLGKRFTNEAAPYTDIVKSISQTEKNMGSCIPSYLIIDHASRMKYPLAVLLPGRFQSEIFWKNEYKDWIKKADTLSELAEKLNMKSENLIQAVKEFNQFAKEGKDPIFHRGESVYSQYYGDPSIKPVSCIRPLSEQGPFYAIPVFPGDIGTKGGLCTDEFARVLRNDGSVIKKLYAIGNCTSSVMADSYPGGGATLGPPIVFGSLAVEHLAKEYALNINYLQSKEKI